MIRQELAVLNLVGVLYLAEEMPREGRAEQSPDGALHKTEKASERSRDWYGSYAELRRYEREGVDFRIILNSGNSGVTVVAPHGGGIEPGTTEIAEALAADDHTLYSFDGLKPSGNAKLHLTSTRFDEPVGMDAIRQARSIVAVHGCGENRTIVYVGGLDLELKKKIREALEGADFTVGEHAGLMGSAPQNLCNRGASGGGVQLEISSGLRRQMFADLSRQGRKETTPVFQRFVSTVRQAIAEE
jgi:phage replication-related protein YjqB (UPF0714/DUF867 family)